MIKISPSVLSCDLSMLSQEVRDISKAGADMVHLDVMDGAFVKNITFGPPVIKALRKNSDMLFDVHLMIEKPERYIHDFIDAGADIITFHLEATDNTDEILEEIRSQGVMAGIAIKPGTPIEAVYPYLDNCDMILVMTVEPGFGGQKLVPETLEKVRKLRAEFINRGINLEIQVDGGINAETAGSAVRAGANILVAGSAVFGSKDRASAIKMLRNM